MKNGENWISSAYLQEKEVATSYSLREAVRKTFALWIIDEKDPKISVLTIGVSIHTSKDQSDKPNVSGFSGLEMSPKS